MRQHRLSRVQVVNWGTFDGAWSFTVPWKGLLMTGPSGAGKSSLLDAMAAVLVRPVKLRFNAAAQGTDTGDRDRSTLTYVRGAHKRETDEATGEVGTAYLRRGATWSGIGLTFTDERGADATLLRLFHIRSGSTESSDLKTMYVFAPEAVDVLALKPYVETGIENRRVKGSLPRLGRLQLGRLHRLRRQVPPPSGHGHGAGAGAAAQDPVRQEPHQPGHPVPRVHAGPT